MRTHGCSEPVRLTFANAAPANDYGYNSMPTRAEKLATFDRFLRNVTVRFVPDMIYVACNTLSVLMPHTPFVATGAMRIKGIVETGVKLLRAGLADTISEDREGTRTRAEIQKWVETALSRIQDRSVPLIASLNCTHYGYRKSDFATAFAEVGVTATILNPNESAVVDLFGADLETTALNREADVQFVTRYAIPGETQEALRFFLGDVSPKTVAAMQNFEHLPDLF